MPNEKLTLSYPRRDDVPLSLTSTGLLLHPTIKGHWDEWIELQGHTMRFATVDLGATPKEIADRLLAVVAPV